MNDPLVGSGFDYALHGSGRTVRLIVCDKPDGNDLAMVEFTTEELDTTIQNLGKVRAQMKPEVTRKLDPNPVFPVTREAIFHVNRSHVVGKEFFVAARHPGFGWLAFALDGEQGLLLSSLILRQTEAITPKIIKPPGLTI